MGKVKSPQLYTRRIFLKAALSASVIGIAIQAGLLRPRKVLAAWPTAAFAAKDVESALNSLLSGMNTEFGDKVIIKSPDIAENGAVVPITLSADFKSVEALSVLVQENPNPLAAKFNLSRNTQPFVSTRIKVGRTSNILAVAVVGGTAHVAQRKVKVTVGGTGNGGPKEHVVVFPWPVPKPSALTLIDRSLFIEEGKSITLGHVAERLSLALHKSGYVWKSYYYLDTPKKNGFVLVSRIERIDDEGKPLDPRWTTEYKAPEVVTIEDFLRVLFTSKPGRFRVIAFVVSPYDLTTTGTPPTETEVVEWLDSGYDRLPKPLKPLSFLEDYSCRALIYEFKKNKNGESHFVPKTETELTAEDHLNGVELYAKLKM